MEDKDTVAIKWSRHELDNESNQQNNISSKKNCNRSAHWHECSIMELPVETGSSSELQIGHVKAIIRNPRRRLRTRTLEQVTKNFMGKIDEGIVNTRLTTQYVSLLCDVLFFFPRHRQRQERERRSVSSWRRELYSHLRLQKLDTESTTLKFLKWSRDLRYQEVDTRMSRMVSTSPRKETSISQSTSRSSSQVISSTWYQFNFADGYEDLCLIYTDSRRLRQADMKFIPDRYWMELCSEYETWSPWKKEKKKDSDFNHWLDKSTWMSRWSSSDSYLHSVIIKYTRVKFEQLNYASIEYFSMTPFTKLSCSGTDVQEQSVVILHIFLSRRVQFLK